MGWLVLAWSRFLAPVEAPVPVFAPRSVPSPSLAVLVVDDHAVVRDSLALRIESTEGFALWETAESGEDALAQLHTQTSRLRIALLDLSIGRHRRNGAARAGPRDVAGDGLRNPLGPPGVDLQPAGGAGGRWAYVEKGDPDELLNVLRDVGADGGAPER